jgi:pimeloyl-ACP methyl ester carboxylesterase
MLRNLCLLLFVVLSLYGPKAAAQAVMLDTAASQYITINDVTLHYKVWGKGEPVLLLHGAMEYWKEWERQIPDLAKEFKVIAVDTRGHGQSTFTDQELSYELFADDMLELLSKLNIDSINVVGFGDGGIIGMSMAMKQPERIHKLVAIGSNASSDTNAVYPFVLNKVRAWDFNKMAAYLQEKFQGNPNPGMLPQFAGRMQTLMLTEPKFTRADLKMIQCPTLIMSGDHDFIKLQHSNYIYSTLPNGFLSIIAAGTHYCIKEKYTVVNATIIDFLKWKAEKITRY